MLTEEQVENTIIAQISKIEARLDRNIYRISSQYGKYMEAIKESENYKNFNDLDIEIEKIKLSEQVIKEPVNKIVQIQKNITTSRSGSTIATTGGTKITNTTTRIGCT